MTSLRFWQKIYLTALALFLICLNVGVLLVAVASKKQSDDAVRRLALTQQQMLVQRLASDIYEVQRARPITLPSVYETAMRTFSDENFLLEIRMEGAIMASAFPDLEIEHLLPEAGTRAFQMQRTALGEQLVITSALDGSLEGYSITTLLSVASSEKDWRRTTLLCTLLSFGVSFFLALMLYAALAKVSHPLVRLTRMVESFADGNWQARALATRGGDEIALLSRSFNRMAEQTQQDMLALQDAADEKQRLVDALSHELRTPLTAIHGYAEYIQRASLTEQEIYEATGYIMSESHRLELVANQLLNLAVLRADTLETQRISLAELLRTTYRTVMPKAIHRGVQVQVEKAPDVSILCNEALLESLLVNLMDNALKACSEGGEVRLSATANSSTVRISIADTGRGMSHEELQMVGRPFFRADKARSREEGGAGLGLSLCFQIVQMHQGNLQFTSTLGKGTVATVTLPKGGHI